MKKRSLPQTSVLRGWFVSYTLILLVPILMSTFLLGYSINLLKNQILDTNEILLEQARKEYDQILLSLQNLTWQIQQNPVLLGLMRQKAPFSEHNYYYLYKVLDDLSKYKVSNPYIEDFYISLRYQNKILYPTGILDNAIFHSASHGLVDPMGFEEWNRTVNGYHPESFITPDPAAGRGTGHLLYIKSLPDNAPTQYSANLIVVINRSRILASLEGNQLYERSISCILDKDGRILFQASPEAGVDSPKPAEIMGFKENLSQTDASGRYLVLRKSSETAFGWTYISLIPRNAYKKQYDTMLRLAVAGIVLSVLAGVALTYLNSRRHYAPMREVLDMIAYRAQKPLYKNEFRLLRDEIERSMRERETLVGMATRGEPVLQERVLRNLLQGVVGEKDLSKQLDSLHFPLEPTSRFRLLLFYIERETDRSAALLGSLRGFLERYFSPSRVLLTDISDYIACVATVEQEERDLALVRGINRALGDLSPAGITVSCSDVATGLMQLHELYRQAELAQEYRLIIRAGKVIEYGEIRLSRNVFYYPLAVEQGIINALKVGDGKKAAALFADVFRRNFEESLIAIDMARCLTFNIIGTMIKTTEEARGGNDVVVWKQIRPVERLLLCKTVEELKSTIQSIVETVSIQINANRKSHNESLRERIEEHIEAHYGDPNLNNSSIADSLGMNAAYVGRFFKEQTGEAIPDFLTRLRVENAKELLADPGLKLHQVGELVGIPNSASFIRIFKKLCGMTPGAYRSTVVSPKSGF